METIKRISQLQTDEVLNLLGTFSRYQQIVYFLLCCVIFRGAFPILGIILIGRDPGHICNATFQNDSDTINIDYQNASQCYVDVVQHQKNITIPCPGPWNYNKEFTSIVTEWDLVCNKAYLVDLSSTLYMIGAACGCIFLMPFGDRFGRRPVLLVYLISEFILGIIVAFSSFILVFIILRFIIGALNMAITLISYCMISELLPSTHRTLAVIAATIFWSFGIMFLSLTGYFIKDWKILQIVITLPNLIVIPLWCFLPESVTWLLLKGHYKEAIAIIQSAAKWNKKMLPPDLFSESDSDNQKENDSRISENLNFMPYSDNCPSDCTSSCKFSTTNDNYVLLETDNILSPTENGEVVSNITNGTFQRTSQSTNFESKQNDEQETSSTNAANVTYSIRSLFATSKMLLYTLITFYLLMIASLSYFGILLKTPTLPGNIYINLFFTAAVEIGANIVILCIINRTGRRKPICCLLLISGMSNLLSLEVLYTGMKYKSIMVLVWTMIGRFGITGSYDMLYLLLSEIFPTAIRNQAMGSASLFENLGSIMAPLIILLAKNNMVPLIIFGILTLIGGVLVLLLPETHLKSLPNSVEQVESW